MKSKGMPVPEQKMPLPHKVTECRLTSYGMIKKERPSAEKNDNSHGQTE